MMGFSGVVLLAPGLGLALDDAIIWKVNQSTERLCLSLSAFQINLWGKLKKKWISFHSCICKGIRVQSGCVVMPVKFYSLKYLSVGCKLNII